MDGMSQEPDGAEGAEQAFEALREEVAAQRRVLERLMAALAAPGWQQEQSAPDYSPTLGAIAQELRAVGKRLDGIEGQPALRMTPADYRRDMDAMAQSAATVVSQSGGAVVQQARSVTRNLEALAGRVHDRGEQRAWLLTAGFCGLIAGISLWYVAAGLLPQRAGNWIAASMIGGGRSRAGQMLMQDADPVVWDRMVRLYRACPQDSTTELCEAVMAVRSIPLAADRAKAAPAIVAPGRPAARGSRTN